MQTEFRAVLFDLDGVIFDTEPQYTKFWGSEFQRYYPNRVGLEQEIKGQTLTEIFDTWWNGTLSTERPFITARLDDFERHMTFDYVCGLEAFVADLRSHGIRTAIVTSSNRPKMSQVHAAHPDLKSMFDIILTSEDFSASKPSPDCYLKAASALCTDPKDCIVMEDSINGLKAGCASGAFVVGLTTQNPRERILDFSDYQIADFTDLTTESLADIVASTRCVISQPSYMS